MRTIWDGMFREEQVDKSYGFKAYRTQNSLKRQPISRKLLRHVRYAE